MKSLYRAIGMSLLAILAIALITIYNKYESKSYNTYDMFIAELQNSGFTVDIQDESKDILAGERKWLTVNEKEHISIYIYQNVKKMEDDADCISIDGCSYEGFMRKVFISWVSYPHFYKMDNIIVLYVGEERRIIDTLEAICGEQFAGFNP